MRHIPIMISCLMLATASAAQDCIPVELGHLAPTGEAADACLGENDIVYVLDHGFGLKVARQLPGGELLELGGIPLGGVLHEIVASNGYVFIAGGSEGLHVVDARDPIAPRLVRVVDLPGSSYGIAINGELVYTTGFQIDVCIIDVADPPNAQLLSAIEVPDRDSRLDVIVNGDYAYIATRMDDILVYDVSDPVSPEKFSIAPALGEQYSLAINDDYLYVGYIERLSGETGVGVFDISAPSRPRRVDYWRGGSGVVVGLYVKHDRLFAASWQGGVRILDVSDPEHLREMAAIATDDRSAEVVGRGDRVLVANIDAGVSVYGVASCIGACGPADFDADSRLTIFDFLVFSNLFEDRDPRADVDGDGDFTITDFLEYQRLFDAGC